MLSHVVAVGKANVEQEVAWDEIQASCSKDKVLLNCADPEAEPRMKEEVDKVLRTGDSVGGVFEVVAHNVPPGLGTYVQWDERLDAQLAAAVMSLQAVKAVEIGAGVTAAYAPGSAVHDEIGYAHSSGFAGFTRTRNNAGGIEGGVSNGQEIRVRGYLKPISTLRRPLQSVDFATREPVKAAYERSDVCVVPAAGPTRQAGPSRRRQARSLRGADERAACRRLQGVGRLLRHQRRPYPRPRATADGGANGLEPRVRLSRKAISVVSTEARRAEWRDLPSTIGRLLLREGLSASRFALRSRRRKSL